MPIATYEPGGETLADRLAAARGHNPEREALVCYQDNGTRVTRLTYEELYQQALAVAKGLNARGVRHGDHVALWLPNGPEWVLFQHATAMLGAVLVPANSFYREAEFEYLLRQSDAAVLV